MRSPARTAPWTRSTGKAPTGAPTSGGRRWRGGTDDGGEGPDPDGKRLRRGDDAGGGGGFVGLRDTVRDDRRLRASLAGPDPVAGPPGGEGRILGHHRRGGSGGAHA